MNEKKEKMEKMEKIKKRIIYEEYEFPKLFTNFVERDYGILYHNIKNINSYDSNHAVIFPEKISNLTRVLNEISIFYSKNLRQNANIYHPFVENYFIENARILKLCKYQLTINLDSRIMLLTEDNKIKKSKKLEIKHIRKWDRNVNDDINKISGKEKYLQKVIKNSMKENNFLFIGYFMGEPVSLLSFHVSKHGCTRFDEIKTIEKHRNNGYAREMVSFAVEFHRKEKLPIAYQWPRNSTSERITTEAGFRVAFTIPLGHANHINF